MVPDPPLGALREYLDQTLDRLALPGTDLVRMVERRKGMCVWAAGDAVTLRVVASSPSRSG